MVVCGSLLLAGTACSLIVDKSKDQCDTTEDCRALGAEFANTVCGDNHICAINPRVSCTTNVQCQGILSPTAVCVQKTHQCQELTSVDCPKVLSGPGDLQNDNTIFLGVVAPLTGAVATTGLGVTNGVDLARDDFATNLGGLPPNTPGGARRPLAFLICDEDRDRNAKSYNAAVTHMVKDLDIQAVIGCFRTVNAFDYFQNIMLPAGALGLSWGNAGDTLTSMPKGNPILFYRSNPTQSDLTNEAGQAFTNSIEPSMKAAGGIVPAGQPLKFALMYSGDTFGKGYEAQVAKFFVFNGQPAAANGANFFEANYGDLTDPNINANYAKAAVDVANFQPHFVLIIGSGETFRPLQNVEESWTNTSYRPRYAFLGGSPQSAGLLNVVGTNADLRSRILIFSQNPSPANISYQTFIRRYKSVPGRTGDPAKDGLANFFAASAYDDVYTIALGIVAAGNVPVTGANISTGIQKLVPNGTRTTVPLEPARLNDLVSAAQAAGVDIDGTSGPLDYNLTTGDSKGDMVAVCITADGTGKATAYADSQTSYYQASDNSYHGTFSCASTTNPIVDAGAD
jgi:ABC-type branched-subunit amino acid transport system substrate-binding protein